MNLRDKRKMVKERIDTMVEHRLDALITLLKNQQDDLLVREDDWAVTNYGKIESGQKSGDDFAKQMRKSLKKRAAAKKLIDGLSTGHLDAVATLLEEAGDGYIISEEEWAEIDQRVKDVEEGRVKMIPAWESLERLKVELQKNSEKKKR